ncbi:MAG: hypothetical protein M3Y64_06470, partial [Gemmatimonadota bacterium]|nr:hypothetical protein [Gemmatimonadota bacterium]
MMSLHDASIIRWKAEWSVASNATFLDMVQVVDQQERNYCWAAQYFERVGAYARAGRYYQRGFERDRDDRSLNRGELARVFLALGQIDSAEAVARMHDAEMSNERDVPLLLAILAEHGHRQEAERIARSWVRARAGDGNVQVRRLRLRRLQSCCCRGEARLQRAPRRSLQKGSGVASI